MGARHFGVGWETTWGTRVAPTWFFEALSESVEEQINFESVETLRGFSPVDLVPLSFLTRGDVELLANYEGITTLYYAMLGSNSTGTQATDHIFPDASGGIPATDRIGQSVSLEFRRDGSLTWHYGGSKIISLSHTFGTDQSSRMTVGFIGANSSEDANPVASPSYPDLRPIFPSHANFKIDNDTLACRSVTIDIENPLDETFLIGANTLQREMDRTGVLRVTGTAEILFEDMTQYQKFDGSTNVSISVEAVGTGDSANMYLTYLMQKCKLTQATPHMSGRERLASTLTWESVWNDANTENLVVKLGNSDTNVT
jgi:hypothetical protein